MSFSMVLILNILYRK